MGAGSAQSGRGQRRYAPGLIGAVALAVADIDVTYPRQPATGAGDVEIGVEDAGRGAELEL